MASVSIHPSVDYGVKPGSADFKGGTLVCHCAQNPVELCIDALMDAIAPHTAKQSGALRA